MDGRTTKVGPRTTATLLAEDLHEASLRSRAASGAETGTASIRTAVHHVCSPTLSTEETAAVKACWALESYRSAVRGLSVAAATVVRENIPPAPDLYAIVRAARGMPTPIAVAPRPLADDLPVTRPRVAVREEPIPPAPDQSAIVLAARRLPGGAR